MASDTAETKWRRYQQLRESGVIDANTYDEVRSQRDQSKVELEQRDAAGRSRRKLH